MTTLQSSPDRAGVAVPHIPVLRWGQPYRSLNTVDLRDFRTGQTIASVGQANAGLIRRDMWKADDAVASLRAISARDLLGICREAGELFMHGTLDLGVDGEQQTAQDYVDLLSATSGLPHTMCRRNMHKAYTVMTEMETILRGLTRGLDPSILDEGVSAHDGMPLSFSSAANALGAVLPSNSPGVNSIWMPAIALKVPVVLKPGREEPWTPLRLIQAFIAAGCPREAFGFYPTDHEGANTIVECCPRALVFGNEKTTAKYAGNAGVQVHGPGYSKVIIGDDEVDNWRDYLDILAASVADNGGRSCINTSCIVVSRHGDAIADALAERLAQLEPVDADNDAAVLSAHANAKMAAAIDASIDSSLTSEDAEDVAARYRSGPRLVEHGGATFLKPTVVRCRSLEHALANTEYMFPFVSVIEVSQDALLDTIGPSLVVSAITRDAQLRQQLIDSPLVERLNLGPVPTTRVDWDQPHEGNLFEFLYTRRAIHLQSDW